MTRKNEYDDGDDNDGGVVDPSLAIIPIVLKANFSPIKIEA